MSEKKNYIPDLKGADIDIFNDNLNRELLPDEIKEIRKWVLND